MREGIVESVYLPSSAIPKLSLFTGLDVDSGAANAFDFPSNDIGTGLFEDVCGGHGVDQVHLGVGVGACPPPPSSSDELDPVCGSVCASPLSSSTSGSPMFHDCAWSPHSHMERRLFHLSVGVDVGP